jgi:hypothetical protein
MPLIMPGDKAFKTSGSFMRRTATGPSISRFARSNCMRVSHRCRGAERLLTETVSCFDGALEVGVEDWLVHRKRCEAVLGLIGTT